MNVRTTPGFIIWTLATIFMLGMVPPLGIASLLLQVAFVVAVALSHVRTPQMKREEAEMEEIRFHLRGSVRRPEPPRPPKNERLW